MREIGGAEASFMLRWHSVSMMPAMPGADGAVPVDVAAVLANKFHKARAFTSATVAESGSQIGRQAVAAVRFSRSPHHSAFFSLTAPGEMRGGVGAQMSSPASFAAERALSVSSRGTVLRGLPD